MIDFKASSPCNNLRLSPEAPPCPPPSFKSAGIKLNPPCPPAIPLKVIFFSLWVSCIEQWWGQPWNKNLVVFPQWDRSALANTSMPLKLESCSVRCDDKKEKRAQDWTRKNRLSVQCAILKKTKQNQSPELQVPLKDNYGDFGASAELTSKPRWEE